MDLLHGLNKEQKEAVLNTEGPLLVLAGAGSGKTRVLTHRIAYLVKEKNVHISSILALTFTNKAAREMKERIENLLGEMTYNAWIGTFHSNCVRILRRDIEKLGYDRNFVIYDTADQLTLIKDCLRELNINEKNFPPRLILEVIGKAKDVLLEPDQYLEVHESNYREKKIAQIYSLYQQKLKNNNAVDFDDIIMLTIRLFNEYPAVLEYYQNKFRYVLVDEYQDTNKAQYRFISLIAKKHRNLCVVGDDDQSIYGWRGADIENILGFEREFKDCKVIKLEQNYRSTQTILDAANNVIKNNKGRKKKVLWTGNPKGTNISLYTGSNEYEEALFVSREIKRMMLYDNKRYSDFAILYRVNAQSRVLEEALIREGIPYKVFGGLRFYDRKEIKDILAYLRVIQNPTDNISLKRIINVPRRGIGDVTIQTSEDIANSRGVSIFSIISSASEFKELKRAAPKLEDFCRMIAGFMAIKDNISVSSLIEEVIIKTGILEELQAEDTPEAQTRIENIKEFISAAVDFEEESEDQGLEAFLEGISLISDIDALEENKDYVMLMTLHSAKGLEFPVAFIVGMEEGVFPSYRSLDSESELEEERRLCYVGMTRAKEKLYITNTFCRTLFGNTTYNQPSRFISEIPPEFLDEVGETTRRVDKIINTSNISGLKLFRGSNLISVEDLMPKKQVSDISFNVGDRVQHKKFGKGTIIAVEKAGDDYKLEIQFDEVGMKRLMAAFANLIKI
ncbi:MAG TPA: DNA helicase PcrA [Clostridiaceae bacterium]|nr:DNA helicase PcrA [Clostridiaceae bacterium]